MSLNIKQRIIYETNRQSDQERISDFFKEVSNYECEILYRQKISRYGRVSNLIIGNWRVCKDISFLLVVLINIVLVSTIEKKGIKHSSIRYSDLCADDVERDRVYQLHDRTLLSESEPLPAQVA